MKPPQIRHALTRDGFHIPYARMGAGIPLVFMTGCFGSIKPLPALEPWYRGLGERFDFIRYDGRGRGFAPRAIQHCDRDDAQSDLIAVIEAAKPGRFLLYSTTMEAPAAIDFAVRFPEQLLGLVLWNPWTGGGRVGSPGVHALVTGARRSEQEWRVFLRHFASVMHHPASEAELQADISALDENLTKEDWAILNRDFDATPDVLPLLPMLAVPTLVMRPRNLVMSRPSDAIDLASRIPMGRAVLLEGSLLAMCDEQTAPALAAIDEFVTEFVKQPTPPAVVPHLSPRESEVLALVAAGLRHHEIASRLKISERTVERHTSNTYSKLGLRGKAEAIRWAISAGLV